MVVGTRNEANAGTDPFSVSFGPFFNFFFVAARKQDGDTIKGVRVEPVLLDRIEDVEVDAEKPLPLKNGVAFQKTFAESYPCFLKHRGILTEHLSVSKGINSIKHRLMEDHQIPFPEEVRHPEDRPVVGFGQKVLPSETYTSSVASLVLWVDVPRLSPKHPRHPHVVGLAAALVELVLHRPEEVRPYRHP